MCSIRRLTKLPLPAYHWRSFLLLPKELGQRTRKNSATSVLVLPASRPDACFPSHRCLRALEILFSAIATEPFARWTKPSDETRTRPTGIQQRNFHKAALKIEKPNRRCFPILENAPGQKTQKAFTRANLINPAFGQRS